MLFPSGCLVTAFRAIDRLNFTVWVRNERPTRNGGVEALLKEATRGGHVDREVDSRHFPGADGLASSVDVRPVRIPLSGGNSGWKESEGLAYLDGLGLEPAMPDQCLKWAIDHRQEYRDGVFLCLGQKSSRGGIRAVCIIGIYPRGEMRDVRYEAVRVLWLRYGPDAEILTVPKRRA